MQLSSPAGQKKNVTPRKLEALMQEPQTHKLLPVSWAGGTDAEGSAYFQTQGDQSSPGPATSCYYVGKMRYLSQ